MRVVGGVRLWLYIVAGAALLGLAAYEVRVHKRAAQAEAAEQRADAAEAGRAEDMREVVRRLDKDAADRQQFLKRFDDIEAKFASIKIPPPQALVDHREVPSVEGKCDAPTVGSEFVRVWNDASQP